MTAERALRAVAAELRGSADWHRARGEPAAAGQIAAMAETLEGFAGRGDALAETLVQAVLTAQREGLCHEHARACWHRAAAELWGAEGVDDAAA